jgi:CheY-like chemotaxis protein
MRRMKDLRAWNGTEETPPPPVDPPVSYVLVADIEPQRMAVCAEAIKRFNLEPRFARNAQKALEVLKKSGAPALLVVDLSLPGPDGFSVIEALRAIDEGRTQVIAFAALPELREFAAQRLAGSNVRVLGGSAAPEIVRGVIERALERSTGTTGARASKEERDTDAVHEAMRGVSEEARKLSHAPGVAVYWKAAGETRFRALVSWTSDTPVPHSPYHLPRVFGWILETGEALVLPDLTAQEIADVSAVSAQDVVRGLVAVPIVDATGDIVGIICVFDLQPLAFGDEVVEALKALGREVLPRPSARQSPDLSAAKRPQPSSAAPESTGDAEAASGDPFAAPLDRRDATLIIGHEIARLRRAQQPLSIVAFAINSVGSAEPPASEAPGIDSAGEMLVRGIRGADVAVRWSAGELLLVLPGLAAAQARPVAERVRAAMHAGTGRQTAVAAGVAELLPDESFEAAVARAGEQLQVARARGHNRVA